MDRRGRDALAIDSVGEKAWGSEPDRPGDGFDFIPMWVADMNITFILPFSVRLIIPPDGSGSVGSLRRPWKSMRQTTAM